ncbi:MAG: flippase [Candidatus ainarchaeum sp.]|nr:flippase [Candidatus ainarchaeum sp.]
MFNYLKKIIPKKIRSRFTNRPILQKIVKNIGWLSFERFLELIVALIVGIWVARYLGPSDFGLMNFAISFTALFGPFINLGLDTILHRELVANPKKSNIFLGTVLKLKLISSSFFGILMILIISWIKPNFELLLMVSIFAFGNIINSFGIVGNYFQSKIDSGKVVKSTSIALIISNIFKIFFIVSGFAVIWFVITSLINTTITIVMQLYYYFKEKQSLFKWQFNKKIAKSFLSMSWPLILSSAFAFIYLSIDQVMIGLLLNEYQVGLYSVAAKISQIAYFLPGAIALSLFPALINSKKSSLKLYFYRLQRMFDLFTWTSLGIILPIFLLSNFLIIFLYGFEYSSAGVVLSILVWSFLAMSMRSAVGNYINSEKLYKITLYASIMGAIVNVVLNFILINLFGINGAAIATVFSSFFVAYIANLFFKETRFLFKMQLKSFNFLRVVREIRK